MAWIQTQSGIALPAPQVGSSIINISTLVDGGRNAAGRFIGQTIGNDKYKYEFTFPILTRTEFSNLLRLFDRRYGGKFVNTFRIFDPVANDFREVNMYVGDRSGRPLRLDTSFNPTNWVDVKITLVEV